MTQYSVTGMSCAACSARVEKAVSAVPGVTSCAVSLLTNSMGVDGTAAPADIVRAVENAGYGASLKGAKRAAPAAAADELADRETPKLKKRLISSVAVLLVLMYFSMGHMWGAPMPRWLHHNSVGMGLIQLLLAGIVLVINQNFFISGFRSAVKGAPNMDTLVAMGSAAAYLWSVYELFTLTIDPMAETDLYFESAAMILTLITIGKTLEAHSKGKTTDALRSLMQLSPKTARLERNGEEVVVPAEEVVLGDIFLVRPGDSIPVDGVVLSGASAVNESALTGESLPVDKAENDKVSAGTINQSGFLRCRATGVGEDTALSQIIRMVSDAAATKAPIAKTADKVAGVFVPTVIGIAAVTIIVWLLVGQTFGYALARGISVLVISCPCALGLATPVAIMVGSGVGAKNGILFKTAASLEETGRTQIVVLDKTGTITTGQPEITDLLPADGVSADKGLAAAERAGIIGREHRIGCADADVLQRDAQRFGGDLRLHRLAPLPDVRRADQHLHGRVVVEQHDRGAQALLGGRTGAVAAEGNAPCLPEFVVVHERFFLVDAVLELPAALYAVCDSVAADGNACAGEALAHLHVVLQPQLDRVHAERVGELRGVRLGAHAIARHDLGEHDGGIALLAVRAEERALQRQHAAHLAPEQSLLHQRPQNRRGHAGVLSEGGCGDRFGRIQQDTQHRALSG